MGLINPNGLLGRLLFGKNQFFTTQSVQLGNKGTVYIDTNKPNELYYSIPQLRTIIGKKKAMFANVVPVLKDKNGKVIENNISDELRIKTTKSSRLMLQADYLEFEFLNNIYIFKSMQKIQKT